jgi:hypothetical protein
VPGPERMPVHWVRHCSLIVGQLHVDPHAALRLGELNVLAHDLLQFSHVGVVDRATRRQAILRNGQHPIVMSWEIRDSPSSGLDSRSGRKRERCRCMISPRFAPCGRLRAVALPYPPVTGPTPILEKLAALTCSSIVVDDCNVRRRVSYPSA